MIFPCPPTLTEKKTILPTWKRDIYPETTELNVSHEMFNRKSEPAFISWAPRAIPTSRSFPFFSSYATNRLELNVRDWGEERFFVFSFPPSKYLFPSFSFSIRLTRSLFLDHLALKRHALFNQHKPPPPPPSSFASSQASRSLSLSRFYPSYPPLQAKV